MTSIRHNVSVSPDSRAALLDAARDSILAVGVRRTTLVDIARRAGVSRMTVYRAFPDVSALVAELMTAEFGALIEDATVVARRLPTARARLVESTVAVARALPDSPLFRRVVDVDPELLLPYVVERFGTTQQLALDLLRTWVSEGQADGSVRAGDPRTLAYGLLLTVQSFVLSARVPKSPSRARAMNELANLLDRYLRPDPA
jgi:AcrR family transcriptional regulator